MREIHTLEQGSAAWHQFRKTKFGASEASAMLGMSPYKTRDELLREKKTGLAKEVSPELQKVFDKGHAVEALARPIVEKMIGKELFPVTMSLGKLSCSCDGLDMLEETAWENKQFNREHFEQVKAGNLPEIHWPQCQQVLHVTGAKELFFTVSDGTEENTAGVWVYPEQALADKIIAGWNQFQSDLETHVPQEFKERVKADAVESMPVPSIVVEGKLVSCNLDLHIPTFDKFLAETKTDLKTDEDFAQGEANAKTAREAAKALKQQAKAVIDQIAPVSQVVTIMEAYSSKFDALGLKLEKGVKEQKDLIRNNAVLKAKQDWAEFLRGIEAELKTVRMNIETPDFATAVKGVRTIAGLHSKINDALAAGKAEANTQAQDLRAKLSWCKENAEGYGFLFADLQQIIFKPMDDFQLLIKTRVNEHKEAEKLRIENDARTRAAQLLEEQQSSQVQEPTSPVVETKPEVADQPAANDLPDTGATIKLGELSALLGFTVTADFIASLGFEPAGRERAAVLYRETDVPKILDALVNHVQQVRWDFIQKKAA